MYLQFCCRHHACLPVDIHPQQGGAARSRRAFTVDLHCHALTPSVEAMVAGQPEKAAEVAQMVSAMGDASIAHNNAVMLPRAGPKLVRLDQRLADMEAMGVDVQVISPSPNQYYYWADSALAKRIVSEQNEHIAAQCSQHPDRLQGLGTLALQDPILALEQLEHAVVTLGLKGIEVSTSVNGIALSDRRFDELWARCSALGALVFMHPFGTTMGDRLNRFYLSNTIGQPLETTIALSQLIFEGTLDRHPSLKLLAAHGGGYLPAYVGRSNHAYAVRPEAAGPLMKPSDYLQRIWFDHLVYAPSALAQLIANVGVGQVVVGTDYPFDMGHYDIHALLSSVPGLDDAGRQRILGSNAAALIGLTARD